MSPDPNPVPTPAECIANAWRALHQANEHLPLSSQAVAFAESQAWSLLAMALGHVSPDVTSVGTTPVVPQGTSFNKPARDVASPKFKPGQSPTPVARRKPGPKPKPKPDAVVLPGGLEHVLGQLEQHWAEEERDD